MLHRKSCRRRPCSDHRRSRWRLGTISEDGEEVGELGVAVLFHELGDIVPASATTGFALDREGGNTKVREEVWASSLMPWRTRRLHDGFFALPLVARRRSYRRSTRPTGINSLAAKRRNQASSSADRRNVIIFSKGLSGVIRRNTSPCVRKSTEFKEPTDERLQPIFLGLAMLAAIPTHAYAEDWTYKSDDGRAVTRVEVDRAGAACWLVSGNAYNGILVHLHAAKGYIIRPH